MAVVGATITDEALFGIPEPDYGDDSDDDGKQPEKQPVTTTLSNESNKSGDRSSATEQPGNNEQQQQHENRSERTRVNQQKAQKEFNSTGDESTQRHSYGDEDEGRRSTYNKPDVHTDSKHSPESDVTSGGLALPLHDSNRGSGRKSPMGPILGVSHEHAAVNPELIGAKKVPYKPQLSKEQQEMQKELQFKQKQGNMLEKKPELVKAMDDRKFKMKKEEQKRDQENKQSTFNVKMGQQAKKLMQLEEEEAKKKVSKTHSSPSEQQLDEFKKVHSKIHKNKT